MRVFRFKNNSENHIGHAIFNLTIEAREKINCILINNPLQSNCICVVNHIVCNSVGSKNTAHLIIASEEKQLKDITTFGSLNVGYEYEGEEASGNLEIDTISINKNQEVDILEEHFLIILPGGNIHIKLEEPQEKIIFQISLGEQVI